ncbi:MAG TPA: hypothetical protein VNI83_11695 [Vicinamibacterales bacterium]|nr:hypothetical protein [Vicinamibacterales bacterium]
MANMLDPGAPASRRLVGGIVAIIMRGDRRRVGSVSRGGSLQTEPPLPGLAPAPAHARLFTPPHARERHDAWSADRPIEEVARACAARWRGVAPGAWQVEAVAPLDAIDAAAPVSRSRLARLYRGRRVRLARGPVVAAGVVVASLTLMSPYPDVRLRRLLPGTLVIRTWIPAELRRR